MSGRSRPFPRRADPLELPDLPIPVDFPDHIPSTVIKVGQTEYHLPMWTDPGELRSIPMAQIIPIHPIEDVSFIASRLQHLTPAIEIPNLADPSISKAYDDSPLSLSANAVRLPNVCLVHPLDGLQMIPTPMVLLLDASDDYSCA
jgi:hypothetical protein